MIERTQQIIERLTDRCKVAIHSLAGDLAFNDEALRQDLHAQGILTVGIPRTVWPINPCPSQQEVLEMLNANILAHARVAANTALDLLALTKVLNAENDHQPLDVHMGLNSGLALIGSTRFEGARGERWTFTASGPVTNLAARLSGLAGPGQILLGPETIQRLGHHYHLQKLGREHLKNLTEAVEVHCLISPATTS